MKKRIISLLLVLGTMLITASFLFNNTNKVKLKKVKTSNNYEFLISEKYEKHDKNKVNPLSDMVYLDKENFKIITVFVENKNTYKKRLSCKILKNVKNSHRSPMFQASSVCLCNMNSLCCYGICYLLCHISLLRSEIQYGYISVGLLHQLTE